MPWGGRMSRNGMAHSEPPAYGGFWRRAAAWVVDGIILLVGFFLVGIYLVPDLVETATLVRETAGARLETTRYAPTTLGSIVLAIAAWAYTALQESGPAQATVGKRLLRLRVTNLAGERLSLARASLRSWPLWLPGLVSALDILDAVAGLAAFAACIAVAFTRRKQGLHDLMAKCLVVRRAARPA